MKGPILASVYGDDDLWANESLTNELYSADQAHLQSSTVEWEIRGADGRVCALITDYNTPYTRLIAHTIGDRGLRMENEVELLTIPYSVPSTLSKFQGPS